MMKKFHGSITALITPVTNGEVDYDAFADLVRWQIKQGTNGLVVAGSTGEFKGLNRSQLRRLFATAVGVADGTNVPVIAGCGDSSVEDAIAISRIAEEEHADATLHIGGKAAVIDIDRNDCVAVQKALCQHFTAIHDGTTLPIIMYNVPGRTDNVDMRVHTVSKLATKLERIVGIKDCNSEPGRLEDLRRNVKRKDFSFLTGEDAETLSHMQRGGDGVISVTSNVAPRLCADLQDAWVRKDLETMRYLNDKLMPLHIELFREKPNPRAVKYAMSMLNCGNNAFIQDGLTPISPEQEVRVQDAMASAHAVPGLVYA